MKSNYPTVLKKYTIYLIFAAALFATSGCGYNDIQVADEQVKASWAQVQNAYQRRYDLIPNLVNTVKGVAGHEKETLTGVIEARARASSINLTPELLNDPSALNRFSKVQGEISSALSRLMMVVERYPQLKANENFSALQAQLEGTENRITVERKRFIDAVAAYNILIRRFPSNLTAKIFGYNVKPSFEPENAEAIATPPEVKF